MIRMITNTIVLGGELDQCDMTFRDLDRIQDAFLRSLVSMYHHRVDYPGFDFSRPKSESRTTDAQPQADSVSPRAGDSKAVRGS